MSRIIRSLATFAFLAALVPAGSSAYTVYAPHPGTAIISMTDPSNLAIGSSTCNYWGVETGIAGSLYWNVTIRTADVVCSGNGIGNQNEASHTFADGWMFRFWHFNKSNSSYDRTCDRCQVGHVGATGNATSPRTRLLYSKYGTPSTSWYTVSNGQSVSGIIGYLN